MVNAMKKIYLFLLSLYSGFIFAFAPGFETVDSTSGGSNKLAERILANAPYSLCELDVPYMNRTNCNLVSLYLGGPNYLRWILGDKGISHPPSYFASISVQDVNRVLQNYHINPMVLWQVPTIGQLSRLINLKLVTPVNNRYYWVRSDTSPALTRVRYRPTGSSNQVNAALERLVSGDLGKDTVTDLVPDIKYWISLRSNIFGTSSRFAIHYTDASGKAIVDNLNVNNSAFKRYEFPLNASNIRVQACQQNSSSCASFVNIIFGSNEGACGSSSGSVFISTRFSVTYTSVRCPWE